MSPTESLYSTFQTCVAVEYCTQLPGSSATAFISANASRGKIALSAGLISLHYSSAGSWSVMTAAFFSPQCLPQINTVGNSPTILGQFFKKSSSW